MGIFVMYIIFHLFAFANEYVMLHNNNEEFISLNKRCSTFL